MDENVLNAGEREQEEQARIEAKEIADKQRRIAFGMTFSTREGFEVLKDLSVGCHFLERSYRRENSPDLTAFMEGQRDVFLYILQQLSGELKSKLFL